MLYSNEVPNTLYCGGGYIPVKFFKLHSLSHYITYIRLFGPPDNYDSQMYERMHKLLKDCTGSPTLTQSQALCRCSQFVPHW